jgi:selenocysteine lyase/cysteine desulfurase
VASPTDFACRSGIVLVKVVGASMLVEVLRARGIRVSARGVGMRISLHFYNNRDDIDRLLYHLEKFV